MIVCLAQSYMHGENGLNFITYLNVAIQKELKTMNI